MCTSARLSGELMLTANSRTEAGSRSLYFWIVSSLLYTLFCKGLWTEEDPPLLLRETDIQFDQLEIQIILKLADLDVIKVLFARMDLPSAQSNLTNADDGDLNPNSSWKRFEQRSKQKKNDVASGLMALQSLSRHNMLTLLVILSYVALTVATPFSMFGSGANPGNKLPLINVADLYDPKPVPANSFKTPFYLVWSLEDPINPPRLEEQFHFGQLEVHQLLLMM